MPEKEASYMIGKYIDEILPCVFFVTLQGMNTYFIFWVEHGIGYRTDVAFDDVQLVPRSCKGSTCNI